MTLSKSPKQTALIVGVMLFVVVMISMMAMSITGRPAAILVDGKQIAAVKNEDVANSIVEAYLADKSAEIGSDVFFAEDVTVAAEAEKGSDKVLRDEARKLLASATTLMTEGAVITVDGEPTVSMASTNEAENALEYLKKSYLPDDSTMTVLDAKYAEEVVVEPAEVKVSDIKNLNEAKLILKGSDGEEAPITVLVVLEKTKTEDIPYETVYEYDSSMRSGQTKTKQEGTNGSREVTIQIVQANGEETARQEISTNTLVAAVDEVILEGRTVQTASRSTATVSDLGMIWPTTATRISSYFGSRSSGSHTGLDIDGEYGDPVWAAKSGTVISAGYNKGYGNEVIISHGNGVKTRYAHMQSILVSKGDEVTIGQQIGTEGSTGNSTGSHLHFEVIINGTAVNPLPYIK
jgi:murein DD-endopeptidase MepM/ murein hydrolase activator NlpD